MPATFLSGVFYSVKGLPAFWQGVSHLNPFFYMIDGFRYGFFAQSDVSPWISLAVVAVALVITPAIALRPAGARLQAEELRDPMEPTPEDVRRYIAAGLECSVLEVEGDGRHFSALIVSPAFEGKPRVARHQLVYAALGERMRDGGACAVDAHADAGRIRGGASELCRPASSLLHPALRRRFKRGVTLRCRPHRADAHRRRHAVLEPCCRTSRLRPRERVTRPVVFRGPPAASGPAWTS